MWFRWEYPEGSPPPLRDGIDSDWAPFLDQVQFTMADHLYWKVEMLGGDINILMDIWALDKAKHNDIAPFESVEHMYKVFDATKVGDVPWKCFMTSFDGKVTETPASWEHNEYQI